MARLVCTECRYLLSTDMLDRDDSSSELYAADGSLVCPACGGVDTFMRVAEAVQDPPEDPDDLSAVEEQHTPFYFREGDVLRVRVGLEDNPHPQTDDHRIEAIGVYDTDGEVIEELSGDDADIE